MLHARTCGAAMLPPSNMQNATTLVALAIWGEGAPSVAGPPRVSGSWANPVLTYRRLAASHSDARVALHTTVEGAECRGLPLDSAFSHTHPWV